MKRVATPPEEGAGPNEPNTPIWYAEAHAAPGCAADADDAWLTPALAQRFTAYLRRHNYRVARLGGGECACDLYVPHIHRGAITCLTERCRECGAALGAEPHRAIGFRFCSRHCEAGFHVRLD